MIENAALQAILTTAKDISVCCEIYSADETPTVDGFDPASALGCFAATSGISFMGREYVAKVEKFGRVKRTITSEINNTSVTFNNLDTIMSTFEFQYGFEGLIMVIRLLSRGSSVALSDTQILFAGRCEKPTSGSKESLSVTATFIVGSIDVRIPRRKFTELDNEGRHPSDPEFEGFIAMPQSVTVTYNRRIKSGGFLGWWNKKDVRITEQFSTYDNYDANKSVPEAFGKVQMMGVLMGAVDAGFNIHARIAACEGPIEDITDWRSLDPALPMDPTTTVRKGLVGAANGPDEPIWVAPGYHSRTAHLRTAFNGSAVEENDPCPDAAMVVLGRLVPVPVAGVWGADAWTDNASAITRFLLTDSFYYRLHENWMDDDYFLEAYEYDDAKIFNTSVDDFIFIEEG